MKINLDKYSWIVLDPSVLFTKLNQTLIEQCNKTKHLIVPSTFDIEVEGIKKAIPKRIEDLYINNADCFKYYAMNPSKSTISFFDKLLSTKELPKKYQNNFFDTLKLVESLSSIYGNILVLEANYTLEDQIIFKNLKADLYNVLEDGFYSHLDFLTERKYRQLNKEKTLLEFVEIEEEDTIYTANGSYILDQELNNGSGAESTVYQIKNHSNLLAKVFKEDYDDEFILTAEKLENNISLENWDIPWLSLPKEIIYADYSLKKPIGYIMEYFKNIDFLGDNPIFTGGDIVHKFPKLEDVQVKDVLDLCIQFVSQVIFLRYNDFHLSDYNDYNFATSKDHHYIYFIDTDSICHQSYVSDCMTYQKCLNFNKKTASLPELIQFCDESLYVFIFTRLCWDDSYYPMFKDQFRYSKTELNKMTNINQIVKWHSIPKNLQELFTHIFDQRILVKIDNLVILNQNRHISVSKLLFELVQARESDFANMYYKDLYLPALNFITGKDEQPRQKTKKKLPMLSSYKHKILPILLAISLATVGSLTIFKIKDYFSFKKTEFSEGYYLSRHNRLEGYVEVYMDNGMIFKGDFKDGYPNGQGKMYIDENTLYCEGNFINSLKINGQGKMYFENNALHYEGNFKDGLFDGKGTFYFGNITYESDEWTNGTLNEGKEIKLSNTKTHENVAKGYWKENIFYGEVYIDDTTYKYPSDSKER